MASENAVKPMIQIRNLSKQFNSHKVLSGLNLDVQAGETLVILGPSGVGKSVLLKHIIGITKPDAGSIDVGGVRISDLRPPAIYRAVRHMGMLFQGSALFDSMNVEENIAFYLRQHGHPETGKRLHRKEIEEMIAHVLDVVGMPGTQTKMPSELSGGMRKRAALARLIIYRPSVVLYDEPTTGLDPIIALQINELIAKAQKELQATSVVVTHDILSALYVGDRLALLRDGKIAHIADPDTFLKIEDPLIRFLYKTVAEDPRVFKENHHA